MKKLNKLKEPKKLRDIFSSFLFYLSILFFFIGFQFSDTMVNGWYQQFMPNLGGRQITDITFLDSLNGYAIINRLTLQDTSFILRTTNRGDNWFFAYADSGVTYNRIQFISQNTGFVCGRINKSNLFKIVKTSNAGLTWFYINAPFDVTANDMHVLSEDTMWLVSSDGLTGGVYRTTNGGGSWDRQLNLGSQNPSNIYFFNGNIGYIAKNTGSSYIRKTTNGGLNWDTIVNGKGFRDMFFVDSLKGWSAFDSVRMTTNGGINWQTQILPYGPGISTLFSTTFSKIDTDTIWLGGGRIIFPNSQGRGMIFRTTNQGTNWLFQIPDTAIVAGIYSHIKFVNKYAGWANTGFVQIHTTSGGDPVWITPVSEISSKLPDGFKLFSNFPNPFNPKTKIKYQIAKSSYIILKVFDIQGKEIESLVNQKLNAGVYETSFDGSRYSSGVYFYSLIVDGKSADTKKMILIK